ncbi:MAG: peptidylprolyl isomerase [Clostridia bacterium]|nr:peptidylprolyl isomerase [Clostridia bacterium]
MKHTKFAAALLSCSLLLSACGGPVVMTIGNQKIAQNEFEFFLNTYRENLDLGEAKKMSQEYCEKNYLVLAVADAMGIELDDATQKEFEDYKKQMVDYYDAQVGYDEFLKENNVDDEYVSKMMSVSFYAQALQEKMDAKEYTEEEKQEYFKNNYRRAKHVLIATTDMTTGEELSEEKKAEAKAKAEDILKRAQSGENFDALVSEFSEDPGSATNPDGYVFTDNEMVIEFQDGTDSIKPGEFTLVETSYGYHVIQRLALDETPEYFTAEYEKVKDTIVSAMDAKRFEEQLYAWADEYGVEVKVNEEVMNSIE